MTTKTKGVGFVPCEAKNIVTVASWRYTCWKCDRPTNRGAAPNTGGEEIRSRFRDIKPSALQLENPSSGIIGACPGKNRRISVIVSEEHVQGNPHLMQIADALGLLRSSPCVSQRRQQQSSENADDGDDDQKFNQTKTTGTKWTQSGFRIARYGAHHWVGQDRNGNVTGPHPRRECPAGRRWLRLRFRTFVGAFVAHLCRRRDDKGPDKAPDKGFRSPGLSGGLGSI